MKKLAMALAFVAASAIAETTVEGAGTTAGAVAVPTESKIVGSVEVRPSWTTNSGEFHTENTLTAGYQVDKNHVLTYNQYIDSNIFDPAAPGTKGADVTLKDGFLSANLKNLYEDPDGLSLSYEPRLYLPTNSAKASAGMITALRNNITLRQSFSPLFALDLIAIPMIHSYSKAGAVADGVASANPVFEQRFYLMSELQFSDKLSLAFPLMLESVKHAAFQAGAKNNGAWSHKLYINPELYYAIDSNYILGVAYMSDSFTDSSLGKFNFGKAFAGGVPQMILRASL